MQDIPEALTPYVYRWPAHELREDHTWKPTCDGLFYSRSMPEDPEKLKHDSQWPALFPAPICLITAAHGDTAVLEREVCPCIVNRFPYIMAVSVCRESLSERHHAREKFMATLEGGTSAAIQFLVPGTELDTALQAISATSDEQCDERLAMTGLTTRRGETIASPVFDAAYLVYETRLVQPGNDFQGNPIFEQPWLDAGSHRIYFLEITAIQLRTDIATGSTHIAWKSLPAWTPQRESAGWGVFNDAAADQLGYRKGYNPNYRFPAPNTTAFEADTEAHGMSIKLLPPLPEDQVEVDNDRARWPCFFPSTLGMVTSTADDGSPNCMPCGSVAVVSRNPFIIAVGVCYAGINVRYAARQSLSYIRGRGSFGVSIPYVYDKCVQAIEYCGNVSHIRDQDKVAHAGLSVVDSNGIPVLSSMPVAFECRLIEDRPLGTHTLLLGEVTRLYVRSDVTPRNPLQWIPWAGIASLQ